jgi:hypothetical protein
VTDVQKKQAATECFSSFLAAGFALSALVRELDTLFGASFCILSLLFFQPFGMIMVAGHVQPSTMMRVPLHNGARDWDLCGLPNLGTAPFVGRLLVLSTSRLSAGLGSFTRILAGSSALKLRLEAIHLGGESDDF